MKFIKLNRDVCSNPHNDNQIKTIMAFGLLPYNYR